MRNIAPLNFRSLVEGDILARGREAGEDEVIHRHLFSGIAYRYNNRDVLIGFGVADL